MFTVNLEEVFNILFLMYYYCFPEAGLKHSFRFLNFGALMLENKNTLHISNFGIYTSWVSRILSIITEFFSSDKHTTQSFLKHILVHIYLDLIKWILYIYFENVMHAMCLKYEISSIYLIYTALRIHGESVLGKVKGN